MTSPDPIDAVELLQLMDAAGAAAVTDLESSFRAADPRLVERVVAAQRQFASANLALAQARTAARSAVRYRLASGVDAPDLEADVADLNDALDAQAEAARRVALLRSRTVGAEGVEEYHRTGVPDRFEREWELAVRERYLAVRAAVAAGVSKNQLGREVGHDANWARRILRSRPESLGDDPDVSDAADGEV